MISYFKEKFGLHSPFERRLVNSSLFNNAELIQLDDILALIDVFEGKSTFNELHMRPKDYIHLYFGLIQKQQYCNTDLKKQKILLSVHLILNEFTIGIAFADILLDKRIEWCVEEQKQTSFVQRYYQYLQKMASNIQIYHACKVHQYPIGDSYIDVATKFLWLFKISNLINATAAQYPFMKSQLGQGDFIIREALLILWNDIIVLYNFLSHEVLDYIEAFKSLPHQMSLQYYELFLEQRKIEKAVMKIFSEKSAFDKENVIKQPKMSNISKQVEKNIEEYVWIIKVELSAPRTERKSSRPKRMQRQMDCGMTTARAKDSTQSTSLGYLTQRLPPGQQDSDLLQYWLMYKQRKQPL